MGTWGTGTFDNDQAMDWILDLGESHDLSIIQKLLSSNATGRDLDASVGVDILSAAEVVAALTGRPSEDLPDDVAAWIKAHPKLDAAPLKEKARILVNSVLAPTSELRILWEENAEDCPQWKSGVLDLLARLR